VLSLECTHYGKNIFYSVIKMKKILVSLNKHI